METEELMTPKKFSSKMENLSIELELSLLDTIIWYCEENGLEILSVPKLLTPILKEKLYSNAVDLKYIKKSSRLPLN
jgi:hypothetical protein